MPLPLLLGLLAAAVVLAAWYVRRRLLEVPCTLDLEATHEHFHAHVDLEGVAVGPGDSVHVAGAPDRIPFGQKAVVPSRARVRRASRLRRAFVRATGWVQFHELYDVGFE